MDSILPFVVKLLQHVPLRRHLWRGAGALLLFEITANIFHCSDTNEVRLLSGPTSRWKRR